MSKFIYIYTLSDPITLKVRYIGQAVHLKNRYKKHICDSKRKIVHCQCWVNGLIKEGLKPLMEELDYVPIEIADTIECMYISQFRGWGFDLTNISGGGNVSSRDFSQSTKDKISKSLKGKVQSEETREKRRQSALITWANPELRELKKRQSIELNRLGLIGTKGIASKKKGKPFAGDKAKVTESLKMYWNQNDYAKELSAKKMGSKYFNVYRSVVISKGNRWGRGVVEKGEFMGRYINKNGTSGIFNVNVANIRKCLNNKALQYGGYIFEYENN